MFVMPVAVGTSNLVIGKEMRRVPASDFAFPMNGNAVEFKLILNARADGHMDRFGCEDMKIEERRSENFQVLGSREKKDKPWRADSGATVHN